MESGNPFDAFILDLTVPGGMGGKETIQKLLEIDPDVICFPYPAGGRMSRSDRKLVTSCV